MKGRPMRQIITMTELRSLCTKLNGLMGNRVSPKEKDQSDFGFEKGCVFPSLSSSGFLETHVLFQQREDGDLNAIVRGSKRELHTALIGMVEVAKYLED